MQGAPEAQSVHLAPEERTFAMLAHISSLAGWLSGIGFWVGPLAVWLLKKDQSPFVDAHGKESLNFQLTMFIVQLLLVIPAFLTCGLTLVLNGVLAVVASVFAVLAGIAANNGQPYRYPMTWRMIK